MPNNQLIDFTISILQLFITEIGVESIQSRLVIELAQQNSISRTRKPNTVVCILELQSEIQFYCFPYLVARTVNPVLSGHSKRTEKMVFNTNHRLMQVKSIAECSKGSILQYFRPSLSNHFPLRPFICLFLSGRLRQVLLYAVETELFYVAVCHK